MGVVQVGELNVASEPSLGASDPDSLTSCSGHRHLRREERCSSPETEGFQSGLSPGTKPINALNPVCLGLCPAPKCPRHHGYPRVCCAERVATRPLWKECSQTLGETCKT